MTTIPSHGRVVRRTPLPGDTLLPVVTVAITEIPSTVDGGADRYAVCMTDPVGVVDPDSLQFRDTLADAEAAHDEMVTGIRAALAARR